MCTNLERRLINAQAMLHASRPLSLEENGPVIALWLTMAIPPKYEGIDGIIN
jgi:hypothetical protein